VECPVNTKILVWLLFSNRAFTSDILKKEVFRRPNQGNTILRAYVNLQKLTAIKIIQNKISHILQL